MYNISFRIYLLLANSINSIESVQSFIFYLIQYSISNLNPILLIHMVIVYITIMIKI